MLLLTVALSIPAYMQRLGRERLLHILNWSLIVNVLATLVVRPVRQTDSGS